MEKINRERTDVNQYRQEMKNHVLTSRFNNSTWSENTSFRKRNGKHGCVYCAPITVNHQIPYDSVMFVLEMNNDTNKIMGIGIIENRTANEVYRSTPAPNISHVAPVLPFPQQPIKYKIFTERNYNRYIYIGNEFYLSREEIERHTHPQDTHPQEPSLLETIIGLEAKLFKGSRHCKRGSGITKIPNWIIEEGYTKTIELQIYDHHITNKKKSS